MLGPDAHRLPPANDVFDRLWLQERHADAVTARRRLVREDVAQRGVVLQVEELGVRPYDIPELGDLGDPTGVALPFDLDLDRPLVERLDVLLTCPCGHRAPPSRRCVRTRVQVPRAA